MEYKNRRMVMSRHLNGNNSLFGGQALAWIDEEAAAFAASVLNTSKIVTVKISTVHFESPGRLGDILEIGTSVVAIGKTSITLKCEIRNMTTKKRIVNVDEIVFVHVGPDGHSAPHNYVGPVDPNIETG